MKPLLLVLGLLWTPMLWADLAADDSARALMDAVASRQQQYPYVYEEQSLVLVDRLGQRTSRQLRRYTRLEQDGSVRFLVVFDAPSEVAGVALMSIYEPDEGARQSFYLPALGPRLITTRDPSGDGFLLGSDFTVESLLGMVEPETRLERCEDLFIDDQILLCVAVHGDQTAGSEHPGRRHYIRPDIAFIVRTDYLDDRGEVVRRQTQHDLMSVGGGAWRPNLVRMENLRLQHHSLLRVERRVFSEDRVPARVFTSEWLFANRPPLELRP